jgi:hypothetical protein
VTAPPQAITHNPHIDLLNVYIQIANKMEFQKKIMHYVTILGTILGTGPKCTRVPASVDTFEMESTINFSNNGNHYKFCFCPLFIPLRCTKGTVCPASCNLFYFLE